jgi:putative ABC transport system ATP-binding protein
MLEVKHLTKTFASGSGPVTAVNDVTFDIPDSCFASVIGRSGSGKTTLLALLGSLDKPTSGMITINGKDLTKLGDHALIRYRGQEIGFIFQSYNLVPNLTAQENVMLPMEFVHKKRKLRKTRAAELLNQVGITDDKHGRKPGRLSGGEQQRVAIARALANQPDLILADEPTGNLDSETGKKIFDLLHSLAKSQHTTIVVVTHDLSIAGRTDVTFRLEDGKLNVHRGK